MSNIRGGIAVVTGSGGLDGLGFHLARKALTVHGALWFVPCQKMVATATMAMWDETVRGADDRCCDVYVG